MYHRLLRATGCVSVLINCDDFDLGCPDPETPNTGETLISGQLQSFITLCPGEANAISIVGHELVHTAEPPLSGECSAYTWEFQDQQYTWIAEGIAGYLNDVIAHQQQACGP